MNLQEYLRDYKKWPATLSDAEFAVSGIPDMGRKWVKKYRFVEVNAEAMRAVVAARDEKKRAKSEAKGEVYVVRKVRRPIAKPQFARPAASLPHGCGPVTVIVSVGIPKALAPVRVKRKAKTIAPQGQYEYANDIGFLQSYEWRQARFATLQRYGAKCQCCGATPATGAVMNVDHIKSRRRHPELALDLENLQVLCGDCNHGKGNETADFRN